MNTWMIFGCSIHRTPSVGTPAYNQANEIFRGRTIREGALIGI